MANGLNGKGKWVALPLGVIILVVGLLVTYGQSRGSETTTIQMLKQDVVALEAHDKTIDATLAQMATDVAVIASDVTWLRKDAEDDK